MHFLILKKFNTYETYVQMTYLFRLCTLLVGRETEENLSFNFSKAKWALPLDSLGWDSLLAVRVAQLLSLTVFLCCCWCKWQEQPCWQTIHNFALATLPSVVLRAVCVCVCVLGRARSGSYYKKWWWTCRENPADGASFSTGTGRVSKTKITIFFFLQKNVFWKISAELE